MRVDGEGKRVLVVDHDATTRALLIMVLEDEGYAAVGAESGQRALALAAEVTPLALILLDVRMPSMDGWAFLRAYRERHPRPVPVIVMTALAVGAAEAADLRAAAMLPKPFDLSDLLDLVAQHTGSS